MRVSLSIQDVCRACTVQRNGPLTRAWRVSWYNGSETHRKTPLGDAHRLRSRSPRQTSNHHQQNSGNAKCEVLRPPRRSWPTECYAAPVDRFPRRPKTITGTRTYHTTSSRANLRSDDSQDVTSSASAQARTRSSRPPVRKGYRRAFIALGSNLGDRVGEIELACRRLEEATDTRILRTSGLWETNPMYVEDQAKFLNGVCEIETTLGPIELLDRLQHIENTLGRIKLIDKGPRNIDLDILLYDRQQVNTDRLIVPHKLMSEREFVLRPLCQIAPDESKASGAGLSAQEPSFANQLDILTKLSGPSKMSTYTPLSASIDPLSPLSSTRPTLVMSILNMTPDSFSDGSLHNNIDSLASTIQSQIASGATIIDIGGESTRPGAVPVTPDEELSRILPAIKLCKRDLQVKAAISVDTYHASVARAACEAGANIINDVGGGLLDPDMLDTIAQLGCTYVLMHNRGTPQTMSSRENTTYKGDLIDVIASELAARLQAAEEAGIRRWRIILDPGIGFAKTVSQNLELLRRFGELRARPEFEGIPWLVGASRKGFIGKITDVHEARERIWGTASAVTAAILGGADIVRVHDVDEMVKVMKMGDAIWRI